MVQAAVSPALLPASAMRGTMVEKQTCEKILTLRLRAAKQTRITQYLKKVKSWNTKTKKFASKQKLKSWRALKCQGGKITNNKKYLVSNPGASITQTPSVEMEETAPEPEIYSGMEIHKRKDFQNFGKITHTIEMTNMKTLFKFAGLTGKPASRLAASSSS
ncbi:hypothetical protein SKAU_G00033130 [Synaphobranchus kaupii]|uniref:Uncharacterized protein n=1 Tax=Synaphobranchus kaupii TaxID=118154 RepID=A0A9Q1GE81_SYNKA|nr:hypothetical protein SKAU_G00033130 [Synaphobranchus kaupii]